MPPLTGHRPRTPPKRRPAHWLPILKVVCEHGAGLVVGRPAPGRFGLPGTLPFVAILEDRTPAAGPEAFDEDSLRAVLGEVHGVVVLTGAPALEPYALTASLLAQGVSTVIVETTREHGQDWRRLVHRVAPVLPVVVRP